MGWDITCAPNIHMSRVTSMNRITALINLVHVGMIVLNTMALVSGIIVSSHLTHKRVHGNIVI